MPEEEQMASITAEVVETSEAPFIPSPLTKPIEELLEEGFPEQISTTEQADRVFAVLEPEEEAQATIYPSEYLDFYKTWVLPPAPSEEALPEFTAPPKELIINIETTGANPWESKLICIGVLDPNALAPEATNFMQETEEATLDEFIAWFEGTTYETLIGYNVSFDYRFLYVLMQRYRKTVFRWKGMELYDLMQQQKQVKAEYVYGYNKEGKLEDWASYLLGIPPYAPQEQVYKWLKEGNLDEIANFNSDKLAKCYFLYVLDLLVSGKIPGAEVVASYTKPTEETSPGSTVGTARQQGEALQVTCPVCHQLQEMQKTARVINCFVCGAPIANPAL